MMARIGSKTFASLEEAIKVAVPGDTVKVSGKSTVPLIVPESVKGITIAGDDASISTAGKPAVSHHPGRVEVTDYVNPDSASWHWKL